MDRRKALALSVTALACGPAGRVRIGGKNFVEQDILANLIGLATMRFARETPDLRLRLGGSFLAHQAITNGELDVYAEYSGTALTACLKLPMEKSRERVYETVRRAYAERHGVEWGWPLGFANQFAMVARAGVAVTTLSEAARPEQRWRLGVGYEFLERPDGWAAMKEVYPLPLAGEARAMDLGLLYRALDAGEVDLIAANSTDPQLASGRYRVLEDNRGFFPPYQACLAVRRDSLARWPALRGALEQLQGRIDESTMRRMNAQVALEARTAEAVARDQAQILWGEASHG